MADTTDYVSFEVRHALSDDEAFVHVRGTLHDIKVTHVTVTSWRITLVGNRVLKDGGLGQQTHADISYGGMDLKEVRLKNPFLQELLDDYIVKAEQLNELKNQWKNKRKAQR